MLAEDWNRNHPDQPPRRTYLEEVLEGQEGPVIMSTDYVQAYCEQLRRMIHAPFTVLGTDGYGRSDAREVLRDHFKVDRYHIVCATLKSLADQGELEYQVKDLLAQGFIGPSLDPTVHDSCSSPKRTAGGGCVSTIVH